VTDNDKEFVRDGEGGQEWVNEKVRGFGAGKKKGGEAEDPG